MELNYNKEFAIADVAETLHRQLGISDERMESFTDKTCEAMKRFMTQDLDPEVGRYPIAAFLADVVKEAGTFEEAILLVFKASRTMVKTKEMYAKMGPLLAMMEAFK